ncbi:MAG TPA: hypothetical protein EYQ24_10505 [Bacteroidetes bacterium]|nr:hypothetical protein [Bacteroidota bacterium]
MLLPTALPTRRDREPATGRQAPGVSTETVDGLDPDDPLGLELDERDVELEPEDLYPRADGPLETARRCHDALAPFRRRRSRVRDYVASLQYETYTDPDSGLEVDEEREIRGQGRIPWRMNRMRPLLRHLRGQLRENASERTPFAVEQEDQEAVQMMAEAHKAVRRDNRSRTLDVDGLQEFAISGLAVRRAQDAYDDQEDRDEVADDAVHSARFFFDVEGLSDRRLKGVTVMGELLDCPPDEVVREFCPTPGHERALRRIYEGGTGYDDGYDPFDRYGSFGDLDGLMGEDEAFARFDELSFYHPATRGRWRVVVCWRLEGDWRVWYADPLTGAYLSEREWLELFRQQGVALTAAGLHAEVERENGERAAMGELPIEAEERFDRLWVRYCLTPHGHQLERSEDPFWHGGPPYSVALGELIDGEVYGFLYDLIDPQRQLNRLYSQIDAMLTQAPKGLWAVPTQAVPKGMTKEQFASEFTRLGSMLFYDAEALKKYPQAGSLVKAIQPHAIPVGVFQFLSMQGDYIDQLSGHGAAMRGETPTSGTPASLYAQMVTQSSIGTLDLFESYFEMLHEHDRKLLQCVLQFWSAARAVRASQSSPTVRFEPEAVQRLSWDVSIAKTTETALYKMLFEQDMKEFLTAGLLTFRQFLQESSHPRARALLQLIEQTNPLVQAALDGDPSAGALFEQFQLAAAAGDPEAVALLAQAEGWTGVQAPVSPSSTPLGRTATVTPALHSAPAGGASTGQGAFATPA